MQRTSWWKSSFARVRRARWWASRSMARRGRSMANRCTSCRWRHPRGSRQGSTWCASRWTRCTTSHCARTPWGRRSRSSGRTSASTRSRSSRASPSPTVRPTSAARPRRTLPHTWPAQPGSSPCGSSGPTSCRRQTVPCAARRCVLAWPARAAAGAPATTACSPKSGSARASRPPPHQGSRGPCGSTSGWTARGCRARRLLTTRRLRLCLHTS
mmetsp:Transcript_32225/g.76557  ORF Transcript_32225/g.76557 Transcript_32225/m.76557 type:complete len:213 (+) Transcript_32225:5270-5908(+)